MSNATFQGVGGTSEKGCGLMSVKGWAESVAVGLDWIQHEASRKRKGMLATIPQACGILVASMSTGAIWHGTTAS